MCKNPPTQITGTPNNLPVTIPGSLAVELANTVGFYALKHNSERAAKLETELLAYINRAKFLSEQEVWTPKQIAEFQRHTDEKFPPSRQGFGPKV